MLRIGGDHAGHAGVVAIREPRGAVAVNLVVALIVKLLFAPDAALRRQTLLD